uniref:Uncharacterized protein n=1 Tax=Arundo donax TaxID=35708 RepID=A0A0A9BJI6_ARUDO
MPAHASSLPGHRRSTSSTDRSSGGTCR